MGSAEVRLDWSRIAGDEHTPNIKTTSRDDILGRGSQSPSHITLRGKQSWESSRGLCGGHSCPDPLGANSQPASPAKR